MAGLPWTAIGTTHAGDQLANALTDAPSRVMVRLSHCQGNRVPRTQPAGAKPFSLDQESGLKLLNTLSAAVPHGTSGRTAILQRFGSPRHARRDPARIRAATAAPGGTYRTPVTACLTLRYLASGRAILATCYLGWAALNKAGKESRERVSLDSANPRHQLEHPASPAGSRARSSRKVRPGISGEVGPEFS
jgi:hypothetical protein